MLEIEHFGKYQVALGTDGLPIELSRTSDEVICLGFDTIGKHMVELRVLTKSDEYDDARRLSFRQRARAAMELRSECLTRITDSGVEDGMVYYTTEFTDGEPIKEYVGRRGSIHASLALSLALQLVEALIELQTYPRLLLNVSMENVMVVLWEDAYLRLRIRDYGLVREEPDLGAEHDLQEPIQEMARLMFSLIVGRPFVEGDEKTLDTVTNLPSNLKYLLRQVLTHSSRAPLSLEGLWKELKSGLGAVSDGISSQGSHDRQPVKAPLCPRFCLYEKLLREADIERIIGVQYQIEDGPQRAVLPYAERVRDLERNFDLTLQILPPDRVVSQTYYTPVQLRMWKSDPARHPHLLRTLSIWETGEFTFVAEEAPVGFALSRLMASRSGLDPSESILILREVNRGIEEADECEIEIRNLHPANVVFGFPEGTTPRMRDEYLEKRVDAWPEFVGKLRTHFTMRSLVEPPLTARAGMGDDRTDEEYREALSRAFVALTSLIMSGSAVRPASTGRLTPELVEYLEESLERAEHEPGGIFIPEFLEGLESVAGVTLPADKGGPAREMRRSAFATAKARSTVEVAKVERAGAIAAAGENGSGSNGPVAKEGSLLVSRKENPEEFERRQNQLTRSIRLLSVGAESEGGRARRKLMLIWAGAALCLILAAYGLIHWLGADENEGMAGGERIEESLGSGDVGEGVGGTVAVEVGQTERPPGARPLPPEVIRRAIIPGQGDEPTVLYDD